MITICHVVFAKVKRKQLHVILRIGKYIIAPCCQEPIRKEIKYINIPVRKLKIVPEMTALISPTILRRT
jgi:hypothetical protein